MPKLNLKNWHIALITQLVLLLVLLFIYQMAPQVHSNFMKSKTSVDLVRLVPHAFERFHLASLIAMIPYFIFILAIRKNIEEWSKKRSLLTFLIISTLYGIVIATGFLQFTISVDDSYHDYKYILNWLNTSELEYNQNEKIMGFTSHLHVMVLYLISLCTKYTDLAILSPVLNASINCLSFLFVYYLATKIFTNSWQPLVVASSFAFSNYIVTEVSTGKETSIVIILVISSLYFLHKKNWSAFAWCGSLLFLTRPEGLFWMATSFATILSARGIKGWRILVLPVLLVTSVYAFLLVNYGSVIPHGALGRSTMFYAALSPPDRAPYMICDRLGRETFGDSLVAPFSMFDGLAKTICNNEEFPATELWIARFLQGTIVLFALGILGRHNPIVRFYFYNIVLIFTFFTITNPWSFTWYYSWFALTPPFVVALVIEKFLEIRFPKRDLFAKPLLLFFGLYILVFGVIWQNRTFYWPDYKERLLTYKKAAEFLNTAKGNLKTIAIYEPGIFGYYYFRKNKIIDLGGLLSHETLKFYPIDSSDKSRCSIWGSIPPDSVNQLKPDCLVTLDCFTDNGLFKSEEFLRKYLLVRYWLCYTWGSNGMYIFVRDDSANDNLKTLLDIESSNREKEISKESKLKKDRLEVRDKNDQI